MVPDNTITDMTAHHKHAEACGYTVGYADLTEKWVLVCPQGNYRGSHPSEDAAWRAAPKARRPGARR